MRELAMICATVIGWFGLVGPAQTLRTANGSGYLPEPQLSGKPCATVHVDTESIKLGRISTVGGQTTPATIEAHIVANCPHHVTVSFMPFRHIRSGFQIDAAETSVIINGETVSVGGHGVTIVSSPLPTPKEGVKIPVELEVGLGSPMRYLAGKYKGILTFTIAAAP